MLVANFKLGWSSVERTDFRLRLSNLEAQSLTYGLDFVVGTIDGDQDLARRLHARMDPVPRPGLGLAGLLGSPSWSTAPWRQSGELWFKTANFTVPSGATRSVLLESWDSNPNGIAGLFSSYQGYAVLRLPQRRDPRSLLRKIPQLDRPARVLLAAEAVLTQEGWPPLAQRFQGYGPQRGIGEPGPPVYGPATRPTSQIVHPLALATGRAEVEIPPEGLRTVERIEAERTGAALVERIQRGDAVRSADEFDATDRLALFLDEIQSLGEDAGAIAQMNALLAEQESPLQLSATAQRQPRRRRRR